MTTRCPLSKVFVDQLLRLDKDSIPESYRDVIEDWVTNAHSVEGLDAITPANLDDVASSYALLLAAQEKVMILAGPGYGKSTITQFLALYHASRMIKPDYAKDLAMRLKLPPCILPNALDAFCEMRFPFRIELRRYAKWRRSASEDKQPVGLATYIVRELIGKNVASNLAENDIFELASRNPILLILDGLDEVPNKESRDEILKDSEAFIFRCSGENADLQIVMSSRPQGYNGEFDRFEPIQWKINDLAKEDFNAYCDAWLQERIKSSDERTEARDRIRRGMESEAVRRLATTLLQATVMLTIVRRKSDIPGERHKLFAKYVDVVFEREKTKIELISLYERELRRLHETVGYRLHEAIGRGDHGPVPAGRFRDYVREVWHLLRGDQYFAGVPNEECNRIVDLATDRLVFLSGKGERQTDIDFVIQPYREYFAALYLSNHTEADPDKVFESLVERGPFWLNVLQFYVALAKPAQQFAWVYRALEKPQTTTGIDRLVLEVEYQRATLATLAEYVDLPQVHFQKGISIAMPAANWWTWVGQDWAVPIMRSIRSGDAWREILRCAKRMEHPNRTHIPFMLWLLPQVVPQNAPEYESLTELVNHLLHDPDFSHKAVAASMLYDLPVNLTEAHTESVISVLSEYSFRRKLSTNTKSAMEFSRRLSRSTFIRLICSRVAHVGLESLPDPWSYLDLPVETQNKESFEAYDERSSVAAPQWIKTRVADQEVLRLNRQFDGDPHEIYLRALLEALRKPNDPHCDRHARALEAALPEIDWNISSIAVLGPSPEQFDSEADWMEYKNGMKAYFDDPTGIKELRTLIATYFQSTNKSDHSWTALIFHPQNWEVLERTGLISSPELDRLRSREWARLMAIPKRLIELCEYYSHDYYFERKRQALPLVSIIRAAVSLQNAGQLDDSRIAVSIFSQGDLSNLTGFEINELIAAVQNPSTLPLSWAQIIMSVAVCTEGIDANLLSDLWSALNRENLIHLIFPSPSEETTADILRKLLDIGDNDSLDLAAAISLRLRKLDDPVSKQLNRRLADNLKSHGGNKFPTRNQVLGLIRSRATISEAQLYIDPAWYKAAERLSPQILDRMADKILSMPQALAEADYVSLRTTLGKMIESPHEYPEGIAVAAIDALIKMDVANREPLAESMWQIASVR